MRGLRGRQTPESPFTLPAGPGRGVAPGGPPPPLTGRRCRRPGECARWRKALPARPPPAGGPAPSAPPPARPARRRVRAEGSTAESRFTPFFPLSFFSSPAAGGGSRLAALPSPLPPSLPAGCSLPVGRREASPLARDAMAPPGSALPVCLLGLLLLVCRGGKSRAGLEERAGARTRTCRHRRRSPQPSPRGRSVRPSSTSHPLITPEVARALLVPLSLSISAAGPDSSHSSAVTRCPPLSPSPWLRTAAGAERAEQLRVCPPVRCGGPPGSASLRGNGARPSGRASGGSWLGAAVSRTSPSSAFIRRDPEVLPKSCASSWKPLGL